MRSVQNEKIRMAAEQAQMVGTRCASCKHYARMHLKVGAKGPFPCPRCGKPLPLEAKPAPTAGRPAVGFKTVVP